MFTKWDYVLEIGATLILCVVAVFGVFAVLSGMEKLVLTVYG